jgi:T-complex protein 1 subunit beta
MFCFPTEFKRMMVFSNKQQYFLKFSMSSKGVFLVLQGANILKALPVKHPLAKLLVDVAQTQDQTVGDGTTSVVLLTAELLKNAQELISQGLHIRYIIEGYQFAAQRAQAIIDSLAIRMADTTNDDVLRYVAKTAISSKVLARYSDHFANIAVQTVKRLKGLRKLRHVLIVEILGPTMQSSALIDGIITNKRVGLGCPKRIVKAKIAVTRIELDVWKPPFSGNIASKTSSFADSVEIALKEREIIRERCRRIANTGVNVIFNEGFIYNVAEQCFAECGIMCIENLTFQEIEALSLATGASVVANLELISENRLGYAEEVEEILYGTSKYIQVKGCKDPAACTILLRAPTSNLLRECNVSMRDALCAVTLTVKSGAVVGGGGALYAHIAHLLRKEGRQDKYQLAFDAFADALEFIPLTLASNGGYDAVETLLALRHAHQQPEGFRLRITRRFHLNEVF